MSDHSFFRLYVYLYYFLYFILASPPLLSSVPLKPHLSNEDRHPLTLSKFFFQFILNPEFPLNLCVNIYSLMRFVSLFFFSHTNLRHSILSYLRFSFVNFLRTFTYPVLDVLTGEVTLQISTKGGCVVETRKDRRWSVNDFEISILKSN